MVDDLGFDFLSLQPARMVFREILPADDVRTVGSLYELDMARRLTSCPFFHRRSSSSTVMT